MSEKRYFKIFSERHTIGKQNKYVALFDLLDTSEQEDDGWIKQELKSLKINSDFLSADKNYLYNLILRSLNDFHDSKTYNLEIKELLLSIEILFHKGLYHECLKLIERAHLLAEECENFQLSIDLLMWKKKCSGYSGGLLKASEVNNSIDEYVQKLINLKKVTDIYYTSNILQANNEKYSQKEVVSKFQKIIKAPELKSESLMLSFSASIFYHLIFANYYYITDDKGKELAELQKLVDKINLSKSYAQENPLDYVSIYNRLLSVKKYYSDSSFFIDIDRLKAFPQNTFFRKEVIQERVFIHTNTHVLEYYLIHNEIDSALSKTNQLEKELEKIDFDIEPYHLIYFYYLRVIVLIYVGQFHKAIKLVNKILNDFAFEHRPQVYLRIEVLNCIIHFELKNFDLVSTLAKKILKKNKVNAILLPFEELILDSLSKMSLNPEMSFKEQLNCYYFLMDSIDKERKAENKTKVSLLGNYEKWLQSKIKRKLVVDL